MRFLWNRARASGGCSWLIPVRHIVGCALHTAAGYRHNTSGTRSDDGTNQQAARCDILSSKGSYEKEKNSWLLPRFESRKRLVITRWYIKYRPTRWFVIAQVEPLPDTGRSETWHTDRRPPWKDRVFKDPNSFGQDFFPPFGYLVNVFVICWF